MYLHSVFSGLPAGSHVVSIWAYSFGGAPGSQCVEGAGGFERSLFITEER